MNKKAEKPIAEEIHDIKHLLKILAKGQQEIKSHLWREENQPEKPTSDKQRELVRQEAINYVDNVIMPEIEAAQAEQGDFQAAGVREWAIEIIARPVLNWLKSQALQLIGDTLNELKKKAIPLAVEAADWVLEQLENLIINKYNEASDEDKQAFKDAIKEKFPESRLLKKL